jgi:Zn-dependent protease
MMQTLLASHPVGRVLDIEVRLAYSLYIVVGVLALSYVAAGAPFMALPILFLPLFVFLHEMGHSLASIKEGAGVRAITLTPIGGVAQLAGALPGPMAEIVVTLAGPFVSLLLAGIFFAPAMIGGMGGPVSAFLMGLAVINLYLALFNLLPIFPLDGGRVALAAMVMRFGLERGLHAMQRIARVGIVVLAIWGVYQILTGAFFSGTMLLLICLHLYRGGQQEMQARAYAAQYASGAAGRGLGSEHEDWGFSRWSPESGFGGGRAPKPGWIERHRLRREERRRETSREERDTLNKEVDRILAKVKAEGIGALSPEERDTLNRASRSYKDS